MFNCFRPKCRGLCISAQLSSQHAPLLLEATHYIYMHFFSQSYKQNHIYIMLDVTNHSYVVHSGM